MHPLNTVKCSIDGHDLVLVLVTTPLGHQGYGSGFGAGGFGKQSIYYFTRWSEQDLEVPLRTQTDN